MNEKNNNQFMNSEKLVEIKIWAILENSVRNRFKIFDFRVILLKYLEDSAFLKISRHGSN